MKTFLYASAAALALAGLAGAAAVGSASAADLARRAPPPPVKAPPPYVPFSWTGLYVGINGGYDFGRAKWSGLPATYNDNGAMAGGQIGYNVQAGQLVLGAEGDGDWTNLRGTTALGNCAAAPCTTRNDFLATGRGRVGFAFDRWLPYATGGVAVGNIRPMVPGLAGMNKTNAGWTGGGGLEYAMSSNWSVKAEYLYVDLGKVNCTTACNLPNTNNTVGLTGNVARAGINYRF
ncbi:MAG: porin family protein [Bradyrhizobiaceae bacterium]|nr:porin family protein [Bradyrhizobiaceae bacterium]